MQTHSDAPRSRPSQDQKTNNTHACQTCFRPKAQCLCGKITPISTETRVVILQHPQEKLKVWNSAMLTHLALRNSCVKVGFSWANLKKATASDGVPSNWAVLYLKSNQPLPLAFNLFNRKEEPLNDPSPIEGIVILDGSWKQAHALWWRNPWLLRLNRIALNLDKGSLRGQAKKSGLSSIESVAHCLPYLGEDPSTSQTLLALYKTPYRGSEPWCPGFGCGCGCK